MDVSGMSCGEKRFVVWRVPGLDVFPKRFVTVFSCPLGCGQIWSAAGRARIVFPGASTGPEGRG